MSIEFDNLFIALAFLLPGFLTSRLILTRTPAMGRERSPFQDTFESLLRSVYIHLLLAPIFFTVIVCFLIKNDAILLDRIQKEGLQAYYLARPLETTIVLFLWLFTAFVLAIIFGYKWDPLEALFSKLVNKTGTKSEDLFYQLRELVTIQRDKGKKDAQLWIQARLKNGYTYRGEFVFAGYRHDGMSRKLMLSNVKFFPYPAQIAGPIQSEPKSYDYVVINVDNCESLEVLLGRGIPE